MAKYINEAKEIAEEIEKFAIQHKLDDTAKVQLANLALMSAKAMPWRGATYDLKIKFAREVANGLNGVKATTVKRKSRDDNSEYDSVIFEVASKNPFEPK